ncbi:RNA polymerase-associated protein [Yarrowia sp. C11]|nr:RNA polymerase-associated protein [Yarrowia sp. E02]KAG5369082.1 RNA polymerase-associated protein [Yarrowia sp. C11]
MSDLDDDLLALAGGVDSSDEGDLTSKAEPSKRRRIDEDSEDGGKGAGDDDDDDGGHDDDEDDGDDYEAKGDDGASDSEDDFVPYPLEGKYKDEADRQKLLNMTEMERESLLFDRSQEMQKYQEKKYLTQRLKQRKRDTERNSERSSKREKLSELKKRREKRARKQDDYDDDEEDEDMEEEDEFDDGYEPEDHVVDEKEVVKTLDVRLLNSVRFSRSQLAKFCFYPEFEQVVVGSYIRIPIAVNRTEQRNRVCLVKEVVPLKHKTYSLEGTTVNFSLKVAFGADEANFEMRYCSDSAFTEEDFVKWKKACEEGGVSLPSVQRLERKHKELKELATRPLTSQEIDDMVRRRSKLSAGRGANAVIERAVLENRRQIAEDQGDEDEMAKIDGQLAELEARNVPKPISSQKDHFAEVNARNRKANQESIRKAELVDLEARRKAAMNTSGVTADPFSRLKTTVKIFHQSAEEIRQKQMEKAEEIAEEEAKKVCLKALSMDSRIAAIEIDIDLSKL